MIVQFRPFVPTRRIFQFILLCALSLQMSVVALGQSSAALSGTVTDPSAAGVLNAKVVATIKPPAWHLSRKRTPRAPIFSHRFQSASIAFSAPRGKFSSG